MLLSDRTWYVIYSTSTLVALLLGYYYRQSRHVPDKKKRLPYIRADSELIVFPHGPTPIKDIRVGQMVLTLTPQGPEFDEVICAPMLSPSNIELLELYLEGGKVLSISSDTKVPFIKAKHITIGDSLVLLPRRSDIVTSIRKIDAPAVYGLTTLKKYHIATNMICVANAENTIIHSLYSLGGRNSLIQIVALIYQTLVTFNYENSVST